MYSNGSVAMHACELLFNFKGLSGNTSQRIKYANMYFDKGEVSV